MVEKFRKNRNTDIYVPFSILFNIFDEMTFKNRMSVESFIQ